MSTKCGSVLQIVLQKVSLSSSTGPRHVSAAHHLRSMPGIRERTDAYIGDAGSNEISKILIPKNPPTGQNPFEGSSPSLSTNYFQ
jgi:hypothetical protein